MNSTASFGLKLTKSKMLARKHTLLLGSREIGRASLAEHVPQGLTAIPAPCMRGLCFCSVAALAAAASCCLA